MLRPAWRVSLKLRLVRIAFGKYEVRPLEDCVFCKIAAGTIPADKVYEDDRIVAFHDLSPQAPVHVVIIPKAHAADLLEARALDDETLGRLLKAAATIAEQIGLAKTGFRIISNCGADARQSVAHLHIHLLGGRRMPAQLV